MARAGAARPRPVSGHGGIDPAATLGLIAASGLIVTAVFLGGAPAAFVDIPSIVIVIFGTIAVTLVSFPINEFAKSPLIIGQALSFKRPATASSVARACIILANNARGMGMMGLEHHQNQLNDMPVLKRGIAMMVDGLERDDVLAALRTEMNILLENRENTHRVLRRAAEVAPAMGLIGTLIGLVQMLGQLDNPAAIGPSMAVALLTTLYGAFLAHAVFTPLAERLAGQQDNFAQLLEVQFISIQSLAEQENPRLLETRLNGLLPVTGQLSMFD